MILYVAVEKYSMHDYLFFLFLPAAARYLLTSWACGRGGKFSDKFLKKFDNSFRVNKGLRNPLRLKLLFFVIGNYCISYAEYGDGISSRPWFLISLFYPDMIS